MTKKSRVAQLKRTIVKSKVYRPRELNADVISTNEVTGFCVRIPVNRGGARVHAYKIDGRIDVFFPAQGKNITITAGELEALAVIHDKMQELAEC